MIVSAAFGSAGGEGEAHSSGISQLIWPVINFAILVIILFVFAKKPIQSYLKQRSETIAKTLDEARQAKEAALKALETVEEKLKLKDKEIAEILSAAERSGSQERDRIIEETGKLKERVLEQAKTNIEFELKNAKESIKAEAVELAMELAEKKIKEKMTKEEQEKLLEDSLTKIGGKG
jgi:F-type H+-transporting ATPase subunit b